MAGLASLGDINGSDDPHSILTDSWTFILKEDYAPVFEPALNVVEILPDDASVKKAIYRMVDRANSVADSLSELGYDHSGPVVPRDSRHGKKATAQITQATCRP